MEIIKQNLTIWNILVTLTVAPYSDDIVWEVDRGSYYNVKNYWLTEDILFDEMSISCEEQKSVNIRIVTSDSTFFLNQEKYFGKEFGVVESGFNITALDRSQRYVFSKKMYEYDEEINCTIFVSKYGKDKYLVSILTDDEVINKN